MFRHIVKIDEKKCNGCGLCVPACAEGAIQLVDGKARLVAENLCDGLGACLGDCPRGAISIEQRQAAACDEQAVNEPRRPSSLTTFAGSGCPSSRSMTFKSQTKRHAAHPASAAESPSQLANWPVQIKLVSPSAPFLDGADLLLAADCAPFAYPDFHRKLLAGKTLLIGCPKLDDVDGHQAKLTAILSQNRICSLTLVLMEVPCCSGLLALARQAIADSGKDIPLEVVTVGIKGGFK